MTTVGEILKSARLKKNLNLEEVEKTIKIRAKFLSALEENNFSNLPPGTFAKGFIKNYAVFLGISPNEALAFYRRQVIEEKLAPASPKNNFNHITITPKKFAILCTILFLIIFFIYLIVSYLQFAGSPFLKINTPNNNIVTNNDTIEIAGKTNPGTILTINNQVVATNESGNFSVNIPLEPGLNTLTITSKNKFDRKTTVVRNLRLEK